MWMFVGDGRIGADQSGTLFRIISAWLIWDAEQAKIIAKRLTRLTKSVKSRFGFITGFT